MPKTKDQSPKTKSLDSRSTFPVVKPLVPSDRDQALSLLLAQAVLEGRATRLPMMLADLACGNLAAGNLLGAYRGQQLVGAVFFQSRAGSVGIAGLPGVLDREPPETAEALLQAAVRRLADGGARLRCLFVEDQTQRETALLGRIGFEHLAQFLSLAAPESKFPSEPPQCALTFEPYTPQSHQRLVKVMEATCQETLDCPALVALRPAEDTLADYRQLGKFDPARWLIAHRAGKDVGCLLLADHPRNQDMELAYLGVTSASRGNHWGFQIVRHAQWLARQAGRRRLLLIVDEANLPARRMYAEAGFEPWRKQGLWVNSE
jgi:ribosomal protein S18 acetylase RimI-like enzyme